MATMTMEKTTLKMATAIEVDDELDILDKIELDKELAIGIKQLDNNEGITVEEMRKRTAKRLEEIYARHGK